MNPHPTPAVRRGFAVVDVETTGLDARRHRMIEVAVAQLAPDGSLESRWSTLLRPRGTTGPVHIHGITPEHLVGAPRFADVVETLARLLDGRILVAHNAAFDWAFLAHEAARAGVRLPVEERLCTVTLARQLGVPARNLKLATLADHWEIPTGTSHRAEHDVTTLITVLARCLDEAGRQQVPLPLDACRPVAGRRGLLTARIAWARERLHREFLRTVGRRVRTESR